MTLKDLSAAMISGRIKIICSGTGRVLLRNAESSNNVTRYGALELRKFYLSIETAGHMDNFAQPLIVAYASSDAYNDLKIKEE